MAVTATLGTISASTSSETSRTVAVPATAVGEISVLSCSGNLAAIASFQTPPGWQVLTTSTNPTNTGTFAHANFYRVYQAGDATTVTVTMATTGTVGPGGRIEVIPIKLTGVDTSAPFEAQAVTASGTITAGSNIPAPTLTASNSRYLVTTHSLKSTLTTGAALTMTGPSGMTTIGSGDTNVAGFNNVLAGVYGLVLSGAGATGVKNATASDAGQGVAASFLVNAAGATTQSAAATLSVTVSTNSTTAAPTKMQNLKDDFATDKLASLWPNSANTTVTGGQAVIATSTVAGDNALRTGFVWSLKDSYIQGGFNAPVPTGATSAWGRLLVRPNLTGLNLHIRFDSATGTIYFENRDATSTNIVAGTDTGVSSMPRDAVAMHCLQIAENGGRVYFQTSPDGVTWTTRRSVVTPSWVTTAADLRVDISAFKNAGTADSVDVDDINLLTSTAPTPEPPTPVEPDPLPSGGGGGTGAATGFTKIVTGLSNLTHYYPLDNQTQNLTSAGLPKDLWGRPTHDSYTHADYVGPNASIGSNGVTFNGTASSYVKIPHNDDFSIASTANGGPSAGAMTIAVFVTILNWGNRTNGTEYMHWMGKGTYNNSGLAGREDPIDSLEWGARHYVQGPGNSGQAITRPGRVSIYYWPGDGGTGNGAYVERGLNGLPEGDFETTEFMLTMRMDAGTRDDMDAWWNDLQSNTQSLNNGTNTEWDGPHTMYTGAVRLGKRGQNAENGGYFIGRIRRLMFFTGYVPDTHMSTLWANRGLAEGSIGGTTTSPVAPGPVRSLTLTHTSNSITGTWLPPTTAGTDAIGFYDVTLTATGQPTQTVVKTNNQSNLPASRTATFTGLVPGVAYTMSVRARSVSGTSSATTASDTTGATIPNPPTNLVVVPGGTQLTLSWTPPVITGGSAVTGYDLTYTPAGGSPTTISDITGTSRTVTGLANGVTYSLSIVSKNVAGTSATALTGFGTPVSTTSAPQPVAEVAVLGSNGAVTAAWAEPPNGGSDIIDYTVTLSTGATQVVTGNIATFTGLTNGTAYTITVTARNSIGSSTATTSNPIAPFQLPSAPTNLSLTPGDRTILASWDAPATTGTGGIVGYRLTAELDDGTVVSTVNASGLTTTFTSLNNGTTYIVRIRTVSSYGESDASSSTTTPIAPPITVPSAPVQLDGEPGVSGAINLTWSPPADNGGEDVVGYNLTVKVSSTGEVAHTETFDHDVLDAIIDNLTNGVQYTFVLVAFNSAGNGLEASITEIPIAPEAPPGEVEDLIGEATGETSVRLTWGPPITGSTVESYEVSAVPVIPVLTLLPGVTAVDITGLTADTTYTFTVVATNLYGDGTTATVDVTTDPVYVPPPVVLPVPNMFAFPQPTSTDPPRIFRPANFGKTIEEVPEGD